MIDKKLALLIALVNSKSDMEILAYLINNCGPELPTIKTDSNRIPGCISKLYLSSTIRDGRLYFEVTGESKVIQGMGQLLCHLFSDQTPSEINAFQFSQLSRIKYSEWLTNSRQNGFKQLFIRIKEIAVEHLDKD